MERMVALEPEDTLHAGETYIGSIAFRSKLLGGQLQEKCADIVSKFEETLDGYPGLKDKIEFLPHTNPDIISEMANVINRPYAGFWVLGPDLYEIQIKFTLSHNPLKVWAVLQILMAAVAFIALVAPVAVTIYHVMPEIEEQTKGILETAGTATKAVIIGASALALYWIYGRVS